MTLFLRLRQICVTPSLMIDEEIDSENIMMTQKLQHILDLVLEHHSQEKILIYSAFQDIIDIIGTIFEKYGIGFYTLTGKVKSTRKRAEILNNFKNSLNDNVLLINYKVGSEGLNIIEATRVILVEPWWNNATHEQAIARAWRIGQTNNVNAHFFINKGSIKQRIMELNKTYLSISQATNSQF